MNRAVPVMEGGPPGSPIRRRSQTTAVLPVKSRGGERCGNGRSERSGRRQEDERE